MQKLFGWPPGGHTVSVATQLGVGGVIELVCGTLVAIGLFARPAAFLVSGMMAVAYCFVFLYIAAHGAGIASLDPVRRAK